MSHRVCPWWLGYLLLTPFRKLRQNPHTILLPYVQPGQTVFEPGPAMGFFTLELARLVGPSGRVIAADLQPRMLARLKRRAEKALLLDRIETRIVPPESAGLDDLPASLDLTIAFFVVHELPDPQRFFREVAAASKPGAGLLIAEPKHHVNEAEFTAELQAATTAGFNLIDRPNISGARSAFLRKP